MHRVLVLIKQLNCIQIPEKWLYLLIILSIISVLLAVGRFFSAPANELNQPSSNSSPDSSDKSKDDLWKKWLKKNWHIIAGVSLVIGAGLYFSLWTSKDYLYWIDGSSLFWPEARQQPGVSFDTKYKPPFVNFMDHSSFPQQYNFHKVAFALTWMENYMLYFDSTVVNMNLSEEGAQCLHGYEDYVIIKKIYDDIKAGWTPFSRWYFCETFFEKAIPETFLDRYDRGPFSRRECNFRYWMTVYARELRWPTHGSWRYYD